MVPRPLGSTGIRTSPIGLGTVKLGRNADVKYAAPFALPSEAEARALLEEALRLGVRLFDTAPSYGESEQRLAPFVAAHRDEIILSSKAGETWTPGQSVFDFSAGAITASVEKSLRRLGTDRLDILLVHSDGHDVEVLKETDALKALDRLKTSGKVRLAGISAKTIRGIRAAIGCVDVVMAPFSQGDPSRGEALMAAREAGLGVLVIKALDAGRPKATAAEAVRFAVAQPFLDCLVLGTLSAAHLAEAVQVADQLSRASA